MGKIISGIQKAKQEAKEKLVTLILAGFGLVAALAWNDAIQSLFRFFFPQNQELIGKFIYAFLITVIVVIISIQLKKISGEKVD